MSKVSSSVSKCKHCGGAIRWCRAYTDKPEDARPQAVEANVVEFILESNGKRVRMFLPHTCDRR